MRAMIVSVFTFNLWQDYELHFLARQFLIMSPLSSNPNAIWYYRNQYHSIYNPIKNLEDHDTEGVFIKQWLPELAEIQ
jgi:deoxyribodipyrimidine photo-lyase